MANINVFRDEHHSIYQGDALDVLSNCISDNSVDLLFLDPPYNIGKQFGEFVDKWASEEDYLVWCYQWLDKSLQKLKPNGSLYLMASTQAMPHFDLYLRDKLTILSRMVWHYDSSGVQAKKYYGSLYEPILFAVKNPSDYTFNADAIRIEAKTGAQRHLIDYRKPIPAPYSTTKIPGNVWEFPRVRYRMAEYENHPSQKPESLLERIILASSRIDDLVLDPFAGTFTTSAVAKRLNRQSIGIELQGEYIKIGLRRLGITSEHSFESLQPLTKSYRRKKNNQENTLFGETD
jgi:site-specific DNA-methyltransferase (adenine-specific)